MLITLNSCIPQLKDSIRAPCPSHFYSNRVWQYAICSIFSNDLLYRTYPTLIAKQRYAVFRASFIADYEAAHDGRHPFLDPNPAVRWAFAQTNETIFKDWWNSEVIKADQDTCSDSLLLYPGTLATSIYRYVYLNPPVIPTGWGIYNVAIFAGVPDMVFPSEFSCFQL